MPGNLLARLEIHDRIGSGFSGDVYKGKFHDKKVAIKLESILSLTPMVIKESRNFQSLKRHPNIVKFYCKLQNSQYNILVMKLYGSSLNEMLRVQKRFSLQITLNIGLQLLEAIQHVHTAGLIHRDIKPSNILTHKSKVILADFGISKPYCIRKVHIPYRESMSFSGTLKFCSLNSHLQVENSRRDDIESIGYTLIYLAKGSLPWLYCHPKDIYNNKLTKLREACKELPSQFEEFVIYARKLAFYKTPDYLYLKELLYSVASNCHLKLNTQLDWRRLNHNIKSLPLEHTDDTLLDNSGPCPINRERISLLKKKTM